MNQQSRHRAKDVAGGFGLRRAPRPATLLRLAETFGAGPDGSGRPRVHLCLADAVGRSRLTVSNPVLKAPMVSALEPKI